jgi:hypothetical protein
MKLKMVVVDLEISPRTRRLLKWVGLPLLLVLGATAIVRAADPSQFTDGSTLKAADLNSNFKIVTDRLAALEARKTTAKIVMDQVPGPWPATGKTAMYMSSGGSLLLEVSGSAYATSPLVMDVAVQFDGNVIGHLTVAANETSSHKAFPTRLFPVTAPQAGNHTIGLIPAASAMIGTDDPFSVVVVETP